MNSDIVWDNGLDYSTSIFSQWDKVYPVEAWAADDFSFEKATYIDKVSWVGAYWDEWYNYFDMQITFYLDRGDGHAPGTIVTGPIFFYNSQTHETDLGEYWYSYDVTFNEPILFLQNQVYWISIQAVHPVTPQWGIGARLGPILMHETVWKCDLLGYPDWVDYYEVYGDHYNMCFQLFGYEKPPIPDLNSNGHLSWTDIKPGATINASFQVMNIGDPNSHLNWTIASNPDWGTWTFTPSSGVNLTPEDGAITVNVEVTAPDIKNEEFQGQVKVVNKDNNSDFCTIPVTLTTPINQNLMHHRFLARLFETFPHPFPILRYLLDFN